MEFVGQDSTGAVATHHQFLRRCPIVSQAASGIGLKGANSTISGANSETLRVFSEVLDAVPVLGHLKSTFHLVKNDSEAALNSFLTSTRSATIIAGGYFGKQIGGIPGAVGVGISTGLGFDLFGTTIAKKPFGIIFSIKNALNFPTVGAIFDTFSVVLADGFLGALVPLNIVPESVLFVLPGAILGSVSSPDIEQPPIKYFEDGEGSPSTVMSKFLNSDFGSKESLYTSFTEGSEIESCASPFPDISGDAHMLEINENAVNDLGGITPDTVLSYITSPVNMIDPVTNKPISPLVSMVELPAKYFEFTAVIKVENVQRGALNMILRHANEIDKVVPGFSIRELPPNAAKLIRHLQKCPDTKAREILASLEKLMEHNKTFHMQSVQLQLTLLEFLSEHITDDDYLGEIVDRRGRSRSAWRVINKYEKEQAMITHFGSYLHKPDRLITKGFREIVSFSFISIEEAINSAAKPKRKLR
ncbi:hypothetical protein FO519_009047 [Halicephalobus sp. NKZ332]|nr:hypothetical protein FO519_009047 [Halicephalobus sp. NKZ332]